MAKRFINVSYEDRDLAKRLGARWDPNVKRWYYGKGSPLAKIFGWRSAPVQSSTDITAQAPKMVSQVRDHFVGDLFEQASTRYG